MTSGTNTTYADHRRIQVPRATQMVWHPAPRGTRLALTHRITSRGWACVILRGRLDQATAGRAHDDLSELIRRHDLPVLVSVSRLSLCDAYGIRALAWAACQGSYRFQLTGRAKFLMQIMRIAGDGSITVQWQRRSTLEWTWPEAVVTRLTPRSRG